ncbi:MAG: CDP-archaeol synthase [Methylotetracoccus sp.]
MLLAQLLIVVIAANAAPIIATRILGNRFSAPIDLGARMFDGRPVLGPSKTLRGLFAGILAAMASAAALGLPWTIGFWLGLGAMAGDLCSSFVKRRVGIPASGMALGLDQIPEALFPLLIVQTRLGLTASDVGDLIVLFLVFELMVSRILFRLRIRKQPY